MNRLGCITLMLGIILFSASATLGTTPEEVAAEQAGAEEAPSAVAPSPNAAARARALEMLPATGLLLIPESTNDRVMAFDPMTGDLVDPDFIPSDSTNLSTPIEVLVKPDGTGFLISDQLEDVVQEYDIDGNYVGVFAPAGGVDNAILDNVRGIELTPQGTLLVSTASGTNADAIAEFDDSGLYLGNFVSNGLGGLDSPFDVLRRSADYLVPASTSDVVHRYDTAGMLLPDFVAVDNFPEQVFETASGNVLVANFGGAQEGVIEYDSAGTLIGVYDVASLGGYRGAYELPNGNILTTNGGGVHEIDRSGNLVETKIDSVNARFITFAAPTAQQPAQEIPAVSPLGLLILASILSALGFLVLRRRHA